MPAAPASIAPPGLAGLSMGQRVALYGTMGGVMMTVLEFLVLAPNLVAPIWLELAVYLMLQWIPAGIVVAWIGLRIDGRYRGLTMIMLLAGFAAAMSVVIIAMREAARAVGVTLNPGPLTSAPLLPSFFYTLWVTLFYGGLFMMACAQSARAERTRYALARAEIERQESEIVLGEAALQALKARVDPDFLLRSVGEIARRYEGDPAGADRLLDALVAFLRCAVPGLRDARRTLGDELQLAAACARVWNDVDPPRPRWCIHDHPDTPELPFPGLWLVAALGRWSSVAPPGAVCDVHIRTGSVAVSLVLDAQSPTGDWVTPALEHQLRVGLRSTFGDAARLALRTAATRDAPVLSLVVSVEATRGSTRLADPARLAVQP